MGWKLFGLANQAEVGGVELLPSIVNNQRAAPFSLLPTYLMPLQPCHQISAPKGYTLSQWKTTNFTAAPG